MGTTGAVLAPGQTKTTMLTGQADSAKKAGQLVALKGLVGSENNFNAIYFHHHFYLKSHYQNCCQRKWLVSWVFRTRYKQCATLPYKFPQQQVLINHELTTRKYSDETHHPPFSSHGLGQQFIFQVLFTLVISFNWSFEQISL